MKRSEIRDGRGTELPGFRQASSGLRVLSGWYVTGMLVPKAERGNERVKND